MAVRGWTVSWQFAGEGENGKFFESYAAVEAFIGRLVSDPRDLLKVAKTESFVNDCFRTKKGRAR